MNKAFSYLKEQAAERTTLLAWARRVLLLLVLIVVAGSLILWRRFVHNSHELEIQEAQYNALNVTMTTVMDAYNNALQSMLFFKKKAERGEQFSTEEITRLDSTINTVKERLWAIRTMAEFRTRPHGGTTVLAYEESSENLEIDRPLPQSPLQESMKKVNGSRS